MLHVRHRSATRAKSRSPRHRRERSSAFRLRASISRPCPPVEGGVGDQHADGLPGVAAAEGGFLPGDRDHAGGRGAALNPDRLGAGRGGGPGGRRSAGLFRPGERVGPGAQQGPGGGVVEHQRGGLDADADQLPAEDGRPKADSPLLCARGRWRSFIAADAR